VSGIAGVLSLHGAPADAALAARMAAALARRAPHGTGVHAAGPCALAHALLRTGDEADPPAGPFSLDGVRWIVADARIDGRAGVDAALRAAGHPAPAGAPAAELILRAHAAWGEGCVHHLLGDFAFAIWDAGERRLFCARDALGLKPFFHAAPAGRFVFASALECVAMDRGVDASLDDESIADWLVHSYLHDPSRTIRRGVRRLPAGHTLTVSVDGTTEIRRWWRMPEEEPFHRREPAGLAEEFVALLGDAVRDRMPRGRASIFLSGGRDSPAVALLAREAIRRGERATELAGFTAFYQRLIADDEPRFARIAASAAGVPVTWLAVDEYQPFDRFEGDPLLARPEPVESPLLAIEADQMRQAASHAPVLLTGLGGDPLMRETPSRLTHLAARGRLLRAAWEAAEYAAFHRRLPRPGVRSWLRSRGARATPLAAAPAWIDEDFARRVDLPARIAAANAAPVERHPLRPGTWEQLSSPFWASVFGYYDPAATGLPLEVRHPFFDVRLIRFVLRVPPAQWYNDKGLLRIGMRGRIPGPLLRRPKTPLRGDPFSARLRAHGAAWLGGRTLGPEVAPWIDAARVARIVGGRAEGVPEPLWIHLRPLGLSLWLRRAAGNVTE